MIERQFRGRRSPGTAATPAGSWRSSSADRPRGPCGYHLLARQVVARRTRRRRPRARRRDGRGRGEVRRGRRRAAGAAVVQGRVARGFAQRRPRQPVSAVLRLRTPSRARRRAGHLPARCTTAWSRRPGSRSSRTPGQSSCGRRWTARARTRAASATAASSCSAASQRAWRRRLVREAVRRRGVAARR